MSLTGWFGLALALAVLAFWIMRHDHWLSPQKFVWLLNTVYFLSPVAITGLIGYREDLMGGIFPALYDTATLTTMLWIYMAGIMLLLLLRGFMLVSGPVLANTEPQPEDRIYCQLSLLFVAIALGFIGLAIMRVGLEAYGTYTIYATIGGDTVAQSFKGQGEMMLSVFSLPIIKYLVQTKRWSLLLMFLGLLVGLSLLGGARKFLMLPMLGLALFSGLFSGGRPLARLAFLLAAAAVITVVQMVREGGAIAGSDGLLTPFFQQAVFAFLQPCAFVYFNDWVLWSRFEPWVFLQQLVINPLTFMAPRFLVPNKEEILVEANDHLLYDEFHTVGGSSYVDYFLRNSMLSLLLAMAICYAVLFILYALNQRFRASLLLYAFLGVLVNAAWFSINHGFVVAVKVAVMQVGVSLLALTTARRLMPQRAISEKSTTSEVVT